MRKLNNLHLYQHAALGIAVRLIVIDPFQIRLLISVMWVYRSFTYMQRYFSYTIVTTQMCRRTEEELSWTYGRAPNAIDIL